MAVYNFCLTAAAVAVRMRVCEAERALSSAADLLCELRCRMLAFFECYFFWPDLKTLKSESFLRPLNAF